MPKHRIYSGALHLSPQALLWTISICFFFNDTATTEIYTLSLHDALPIRMLVDQETEGGIPDTLQALIAARIDRLRHEQKVVLQRAAVVGRIFWLGALDQLNPDIAGLEGLDRKSTRLNSSHSQISYAVFCL